MQYSHRMHVALAAIDCFEYQKDVFEEGEAMRFQHTSGAKPVSVRNLTVSFCLFSLSSFHVYRTLFLVSFSFFFFYLYHRQSLFSSPAMAPVQALLWAWHLRWQ